jgi:3-deoxy-D-manno-octulosonate 8-phosphate phosphatase (KDO 8-P phosphatase)
MLARSSRRAGWPRYDHDMPLSVVPIVPKLTAEERAREIKLILFDVDGVLTDGAIIVHPNPDGTATEVKHFSAHDGLGVSLARLAGLRIGWVTKRNSATVSVRARDLKIEFLYQGQSHKMQAVEEILVKAGLTMPQVAYVGDDIVDLPVMRLAGLAIASANARPQVKAAAHWVTPHAGGQGAGRDAIDFILAAQELLDDVIEQYLDPSNNAAKLADIGTGNM